MNIFASSASVEILNAKKNEKKNGIHHQTMENTFCKLNTMEIWLLLKMRINIDYYYTLNLLIMILNDEDKIQMVMVPVNFCQILLHVWYAPMLLTVPTPETFYRNGCFIPSLSTWDSRTKTEIYDGKRQAEYTFETMENIIILN